MFIVPPSDESNDENSVDAGSEGRVEILDTGVTMEGPSDVLKAAELLPDPHPALLLEDVLRTIFEWADNQTRARGAVVSRRFMRPALAALWRKSAKMFDMLSLIVPLEREPSMLVSLTGRNPLRVALIVALELLLRSADNAIRLD